MVNIFCCCCCLLFWSAYEFQIFFRLAEYIKVCQHHGIKVFCIPILIFFCFLYCIMHHTSNFHFFCWWTICCSRKKKKEKLLIKWYTMSILFNDIAFSDMQLCRIIIIISFLDLLLYLQFKYAKYMSIIIVVVVVIITYPKIT